MWIVCSTEFDKKYIWSFLEKEGSLLVCVCVWAISKQESESISGKLQKNPSEIEDLLWIVFVFFSEKKNRKNATTALEQGFLFCFYSRFQKLFIQLSKNHRNLTNLYISVFKYHVKIIDLINNLKHFSIGFNISRSKFAYYTTNIFYFTLFDFLSFT